MNRVDITSIEHELATMWATAKPESGNGIVRAIACNLVVLAATDEADVSAAVAEIAATVPHRALVVIATEQESAPVGAWIAMHCRRTGPEAQVCCEQITVQAPRREAERVASTVLALLVPDLPNVAWLRDPAEIASPVLDRMARHLDRLILDGEAMTASDCAALAAWSRAHPEVAIADLAWERLAVWRELVAGSFDGAPFTGLLAEVASVRVEHGPRSEGAARLLVGWLGSRLGWKIVSPSAGRDARGGAIALERTMLPEASGLQSITLTMRDGTRCRVQRDAAAGAVVARLEHAAACAVPRTLAEPSVGAAAWVVRVLQRPPRNVAYREAMAATAAFGAGG
jgi:glucose-6-phosphate dehydrogenase assembly protein OpcA